jgi:hypothetical protein
MLERSFRSALPHSGADTTQPLEPTKLVGRLGTTATYATSDYREFLRIRSTHLQPPVLEYTAVCAASSVTPDKYTVFHVRNSSTLIYNNLWHRKEEILLWSCMKQKIVSCRHVVLLAP